MYKRNSNLYKYENNNRSLNTANRCTTIYFDSSNQSQSSYQSSYQPRYQSSYQSSYQSRYQTNSQTNNKYEDYSELVKQFDFNNKTKLAISNYNKLLQKFNSEKKSWFSTKKACKNTSNTRRNTRRNNRYNSRYFQNTKKNTKANTKANNARNKECNDTRTSLEALQNIVLNEISIDIKESIIKLIDKIQRTPKLKRLERIACYIKLFMDLHNKYNCIHDKSKNLSIDKLISDLLKYPELKNNPEFTTAYINNILTIRENATKDLVQIQKNKEISETFKTLIKSYPDCNISSNK